MNLVKVYQMTIASEKWKCDILSLIAESILSGASFSSTTFLQHISVYRGKGYSHPIVVTEILNPCCKKSNCGKGYSHLIVVTEILNPCCKNSNCGKGYSHLIIVTEILNPCCKHTNCGKESARTALYS